MAQTKSYILWNQHLRYLLVVLQKSLENGRNPLEGGKKKAAQPQNKKFKTFSEIDGDEVERFVI